MIRFIETSLADYQGSGDAVSVLSWSWHEHRHARLRPQLADHELSSFLDPKVRGAALHILGD